MGMPGLRIGYSLSSRSVAAILKERQPPWSVNTVAQRAAEAAIADRRHARRCLAYVGRERARMTKQLASLAGVTVIPSSTNFLFAELPPLMRRRPDDGSSSTTRHADTGLLVSGGLWPAKHTHGGADQGRKR